MPGLTLTLTMEGEQKATDTVLPFTTSCVAILKTFACVVEHGANRQARKKMILSIFIFALRFMIALSCLGQ